jgi:ABC-type nickel/cobalt efflux system permease component RcnA
MNDLSILISAAASIGFFHTLFGPDHYLPFIVMAQSGRWSLRKTAWVTLLSGLGHVLSSVILGLAGVVLGIAVARLEWIESFRGNLAAWALIAFGLVYFIWGLRRAWRQRPHRHFHLHPGHSGHTHVHNHQHDHVHVHETEAKANLTPWILFTIFVLGPCEPLIPLLIYPAAQNSWSGLFWVSLVFGLITVVTMLGVVLLVTLGTWALPIRKFDRYIHAVSGATILFSGLAIHFLGL